MIPFRKTVGFRLLSISFILLALPLLVDSFILVHQSFKPAIVEAKGYLVEAAHERELPLAQLQPLKKPLLEVLSYFLKLKSDFPEKPRTNLNEKLEKMAEIGGFTGIFLLKVVEGNQLIVTASSDPQFLGRDYTNFFRLNDPFLSEGLKNETRTYISYSDQTLQPDFVVTYPIYDEDEKTPLGILAVSDSISDKLRALLAEENRRYDIQFALLLPSTVVFAASDPTLRFQHFRSLDPEYRKTFIEEYPDAAELLPESSLEGGELMDNPFRTFFWRGEEQIGYVKHLPDATYSLLTYASKRDVFHAPVANFLNIYAVYFLILLIGGTVAYVVTMRMAKPMQSLSLVMEEIKKGNHQIRYQKDLLGFEINALGIIFNEMTDTFLEQKRVAQEERVQQELYGRELRLGQNVQRSLFPQKMPTFQGIEIAEKYIPAIEVAGDFYDMFIKQAEHSGESSQLILSVADGSGKGVRACFYSLIVRSMLRTFIEQYEDIGMAMSATNNLFSLDTVESGMFVTVIVGAYNSEKQTFNYFSSGHNPPLLRRADGQIEWLAHHGIAMGIMTTEEQHAISIRLKKGDTVIFYTDGVTEAHNMKNELFGEERLEKVIQNEGWRSAEEVLEITLKQVDSFVGRASQHDDITLLVMKVI